jgi:protocatechuate 3,4-dioxygenase beta subunit
MTQGRLGRSLLVRYQPGRDRVTGIRLTLRPTTAITGTVVDMKGYPVADATVKARDEGMPVRWELAEKTRTDEEGRFRIAGLFPGACWLNVEADGFLPLREVRCALPMRGDGIVLRLERGVTVQGNVLFAGIGKPAPGVWIQALAKLRWGPVNISGALSDAEGHFEILVHPEIPTRLTVRWEGYIADREPVIEAARQDAADAVVIELIKGGSIAGIVREEGTELPVADVTITAESPVGDTIQVKSDSEGTFSLDGLAPGVHTLDVIPYEYVVSKGTFHVDVSLGEEPAKAEFWVSAKPTVGGIVVDAEGEPILGAFVTACQESAYGDVWARPTGVTDTDGRFLLAALKSNARFIALLASHPGYGRTRVELDEAQEAGSARDVRIVLEKAGGSIAGRVAEDSGSPIQLAQVRLIALDVEDVDKHFLPELACTITDEQGRYAFGAASPGTYAVKAAAFGQEAESGEVVLAAEEKLHDVDLTFATAGHITGRVTAPDGTPAVGIEVIVYPATGGQVFCTVRTDAEGRFKAENLEENRKYTVRVRGEPKGYEGAYRTVTCSTDNADFVLEHPEPCTVRGFVYRKADGRPVTQFSVRIVTQARTYSGKDLDNIQSEDGSFEISDVAPGESIIEVTAPGCVKFESQPFETKPGEVVTQTIFLETGGTIRGAVYRKSDRSPVTEYHLELFRKTDAGLRRQHDKSEDVRSDKGSFACADVSAGTYVIAIFAEGLPDFMTEPFEVAANSETLKEILISDGGVVKGRVVDESGRPVPDAIVDESRSYWERHNAGIPYRYAQERPNTPNRTRTNSAGEFVLRNLTPGKVTIRAEHPDYAECEVPGITVSEEAPTENVVITLERGTVLYGWIKDLEGNPLRGVTLRIRGDGPFISAGLDRNGRYRSPALARGEYELDLSYCDAVLPEVNVEDQKEIELNIDFTQAGTISGTVDLPQETDDITIVAYLTGLDEMEGTRWATPADDGTFEFRGVLPGKYKLWPGAWKSTAAAPRVFEVVTNPKEIIVNVGAREDVQQDIDVIELKER